MTDEARDLAEIRDLDRRAHEAHAEYVAARKKAWAWEETWEDLAGQLHRRILASEEVHPLFDREAAQVNGDTKPKRQKAKTPND